MNKFLQYGEKVDGYDKLVINEREARAAAGLLFVGAFIAVANATMLETLTFAKGFIVFFFIDFIIRIIQPRLSPSLLIGRYFVRNQIPEYVGASQKRFAWGIGTLFAIPVFYYLDVIDAPNVWMLVLCLVCMVLLFFESAFSICWGCKIYNFIYAEKATNCPGGICEIREKDDIQKFTFSQVFILIISIFILSFYSYKYIMYEPDGTVVMTRLKAFIMGQEKFDKYQKEIYGDDEDDDEDDESMNFDDIEDK